MTPGTGRAFQLVGRPPDVTIEHNTVVHGSWPNTFVMFDEQPPARGLVIRNNILSYGLYGMYGSGVGSGSAALATFAPDAIFSGNVMYGFDPDNLGWIESQYPAGNTYIPDAAAVGLGEGTGTRPLSGARNDSRADVLLVGGARGRAGERLQSLDQGLAARCRVALVLGEVQADRPRRRELEPEGEQVASRNLVRECRIE